MTHELMTLPYAADALAPVISKETVEFHHGKHLLAYVNTLNSLIPGTEFENADLLDIVRKSEGKYLIKPDRCSIITSTSHSLAPMQEVLLRVLLQMLLQRSGDRLRLSKQLSSKLVQAFLAQAGYGLLLMKMAF